MARDIRAAHVRKTITKPRWSTPFVGRRLELEALSRTDISCTFLFGEPGSGKTRLLSESRNLWTKGKAFVVRCQRAAQNAPFEPILSLVQIVRRNGWIDEPTVRAVVDAAPRDRPYYVREALEVAASRIPALLQFEDLQYCDSSSLDLLQYCVDRLQDSRITWHFSARLQSDRVRQMAAALAQAESAHTVLLLGLSKEELHDFARAFRPGTSFDDETIEQLHKRTAGNPLYAQLVLSSDEFAKGTLHALLRERLASVLNHATMITGWLSASRGPLSLADFAELSNLSEQTVADAAVELLDAGIAVLTDNGLVFRHELIRDASYNQLTPDSRAAIHSALADRSTGVWDQASHLIGAQRFEEAVASLNSLGWKHLSDSRPADASAAFSRARGFTQRKNPTYWESTMGLASAMAASGERASAFDEYGEFERDADLLSPSLRFDLRLKFAESLMQYSLIDKEADTILARAGIDVLSGSPGMLPRFYLARGQTKHYAGSHAEALSFIESGIRICGPQQNAQVLELLRFWSGISNIYLGRIGIGMALAEAATERLRTLGYVTSFAACCCVLCTACMIASDPAHRVYWARQALGAPEPKNRRSTMIAKGHLVTELIYEGRMREGLAASLDIARECLDVDFGVLHFVVLCNNAQFFAMLGEYQQAEAVLLEASASRERCDVGPWSRYYDLMKGILEESRGDLQTAAVHYRESACWSDHIPFDRFELKALCNLVRVSSLSGDAETAGFALEALRSKITLNWPVVPMLIAEAEGYRALMSGETERGCSLLRTTAGYSTTDPFEQAYLLMHVADALRDPALFKEVIHSFDSLEAAAMAERARALARRHGFRPGRPHSRNGLLSDRERTIAQLIAGGMTNIKIGKALDLSPKTVESVVHTILVKLDVTSRAQIAAYVSAASTEGDVTARSGAPAHAAGSNGETH